MQLYSMLAAGRREFLPQVHAEAPVLAAGRSVPGLSHGTATGARLVASGP